MGNNSSLTSTIPVELLRDCIFPFLYSNDLRALYHTGSSMRLLFRIACKKFTFDNLEDELSMSDVLWLRGFGVQFLSLKVNLHTCRKLVKTRPCGLKIASLKQLHITAGACDEILMQCGEGCPQLEVLRISGHGCFTSNGISSIARCRQLHTISWTYNRIAHAAFRAMCQHCPQLRHIHCHGLTDESLFAIADTYPHLQTLSLTCSDVTDTGLRTLADKCHDFCTLGFLDCCNITSAGLAALWAVNPNLTDFSNTNYQVMSDDDIMSLLRSCPRLQQLDVSSRTVTNAAIFAVASLCPQLAVLNIRSCFALDDSALFAVEQNCFRLKSIDVSVISNISDVGISALSAGCPLLQKFTANHTRISDAGVILLTQRCRDLRKISMNYCDRIGGNAVYAIAVNCPLMTELYLNNCKSVDYACLHVIAQYCRNLTALDVSYIKLLDANEIVNSIQCIVSSCRSLKSLRCLGHFSNEVRRILQQLISCSSVLSN